MRPFADLLDTARERIDGARSVLLVGLDGVVVARSAGSSPIADELLAASFADLLRRADLTSRDTALGPTDELTVVAPEARVVLRMLGREHALLVQLGPEAFLGRARHELRLAADRITPALSV